MVINPVVFDEQRSSDIFSRNLDQGVIHQPSGGVEGQSSYIVIAAEHIRDSRSVLNRILSENTGKKLSEIERDTERDHWLNAEAAARYGIIDRVLREVKGGKADV